MSTHRSRTVVIAALILMATAIIYVYFRKPIPEAEPIWSAHNALLPAEPLRFEDDQDSASLISALRSSLTYYKRLSPQQSFSFGGAQFTAKDLAEALEDLSNKVMELGISTALSDYIYDNYLFFRSAINPVLFTGYYLPLLKGSYTRSKRFGYPIYRRPDNLVRVELSSFSFFSKFPGLPETVRGRLTEEMRLVPYYSRKEIDFELKLAGAGLELLWVESPVDAFFLHIQGSGIVELEDGSRVLVGYSDQNGQPYQAVGKALVDRGVLAKDEVSMQSIRDYLLANPGEQPDLFSYNPSYVFFKIGGRDPIGNIGVPLSAQRSIATDSRLFPNGSLSLIKTQKPIFDQNLKITGWKEFSRLVLNQDTGGAIRGPGRVDLFTGFGAEAEVTAGHMRQQGELYFLMKRPIALTQ